MRHSDDTPNEIECCCGAQEKLTAYTDFIQGIAQTLGVAQSVDKVRKTANLRHLEKFDIIEQAQAILHRFGDFERENRH